MMRMSHRASLVPNLSRVHPLIDFIPDFSTERFVVPGPRYEYQALGPCQRRQHAA
jgi:hypothetical protein